ncbi:MAG: glycosyltransferase family 39 protein [Candidatus Eisenbacteria sp.]|nr:glycosyltransferase family 39 protein [Candidatus Eisenbacteria bacterium]
MTPEIEHHNHPRLRGLDWGILVIFLVALAARLVYFLTVRNDAYYQVPLLDSAWYHRSAIDILKGDFRGEDVFFRGPLYSYFVAFWYRVLGENPQGPRIVQLVLGAGTCALLSLAARQVFDRRTALISGLVAALYPTLIFFDGELLATGIATFLGALFLYLVLRADGSRSLRRWVVPGLILGLAALTRPQILILGTGVLIWLLADRSQGRRSLIAFLAGAMIIITPVTIRNAVIGNDAVLIASQGGVNFYMGNNPEADGKSAQLPGWTDPESDWSTFEDDTRRMAEAEAGRPLTPSRESSFWTGKALRFIGEQPWQATGLFARKIYFLLNGFEIPNNKDLYFFKARSRVLNTLLWKRGLAFPTGLLIPLAAVGLALSTTRPRKYLVLYLFLFCQALAILLFFVCARFRVALLPVAIPFAVWGILETARQVRRGCFRSATVAGLIGISFLILSNSGSLGVAGTARWQDHYDLGLVYAEQKQFERARTAFEEAYHLKSDEASVIYNLGLAYLSLAEHEGAIPFFRKAIRLRPRFLPARNNLGICLGQLGKLDEAEGEFRWILRMDPDHLEARANLRAVQELKEREQ